MAGVPLHTVQELLGYKTFSMTIRYCRPVPGHMQEAVDKLVPLERLTETGTETEAAGDSGKETTYVI